MKIKYIIPITAITISIICAYFSIWGLSQLFAGASTAVIIMASALEIGKVITTTALHSYWGVLNKGLKIYLTISVGVLMVITSAGIYGFLSNAYQKTANKMEIQNGEISVLDSKKNIFKENILDNDKIINVKNKRLEQLTNLRVNQESRLDNATSNRSQNNVRRDISNADNEIQKLSLEIDALNIKNSALSDSIGKYDISILELKSNSEISGEVGPLKYIAELTHVDMGVIVNYLILLLIFVFDPLAIALILMANKVFQRQNIPTNNDIDYEPVSDVSSDSFVYDENEMSDMIPLVDNYDIQNIIQNGEFKDIGGDSTLENDSNPKENIKPTEDSKIVSESRVEVPFKKEPIIPNGKIELSDIKEKHNRGFQTQIPEPKVNNTIERVSTNKFKMGDNNELNYKRL